MGRIACGFEADLLGPLPAAEPLKSLVHAPRLPPHFRFMLLVARTRGLPMSAGCRVASVWMPLTDVLSTLACLARPPPTLLRRV